MPILRTSSSTFSRCLSRPIFTHLDLNWLPLHYKKRFIHQCFQKFFNCLYHPSRIIRLLATNTNTHSQSKQQQYRFLTCSFHHSAQYDLRSAAPCTIITHSVFPLFVFTSGLSFQLLHSSTTCFFSTTPSYNHT